MHSNRRLGAARCALLHLRLARLAAAGLVLGVASCGSDTQTISAAWVEALPAIDPDESIETPPPPFSEDIFPCTECHDPEIPVNPKRRELTMAHEEIVLHHDEEHRWCLDCHTRETATSCTSPAATLVPFEESYRLCGQCHGDKYRDWRAGVHGRRTGQLERREDRTCCACTATTRTRPRFKPLEPEPPPPIRARRATPMSCDDHDDVSRRDFLCAVAGCAAAAAGAAARDLDPHRLLPPALPRALARRSWPSILADLERELHASATASRSTVGTEAPLAGRRVRLRARHLALHRLPPLRLRLRRGEQPEPRPAGPVDPRAGDGQGARASTSPHANAYYDAETVPREGHFYLPVACQQCENPPCVKSCPVGATWQEDDGIVVIDYDWCIGCRCCMSACPYGARHFNWAEPAAARPRRSTRRRTTSATGRGRRAWSRSAPSASSASREGRYPRCVEVCPVGARKFGNLLDPDERDPLHAREQARLRAQERAQHAPALLLLLRL